MHTHKCLGYQFIVDKFGNEAPDVNQLVHFIQKGCITLHLSIHYTQHTHTCISTVHTYVHTHTHTHTHNTTHNTTHTHTHNTHTHNTHTACSISCLLALNTCIIYLCALTENAYILVKKFITLESCTCCMKEMTSISNTWHQLEQLTTHSKPRDRSSFTPCTNEVHAHPMKRYSSDVSHLPPPSYCSYQLPWQTDKALWNHLRIVIAVVVHTL